MSLIVVDEIVHVGEELLADEELAVSVHDLEVLVVHTVGLERYGEVAVLNNLKSNS